MTSVLIVWAKTRSNDHIQSMSANLMLTEFVKSDENAANGSQK